MGLTKIKLVTNWQNLGKENDIVLVKTGFARNYLIPNAIALPISMSTLKHEKKPYTMNKEDSLILLHREITEQLKNMELIIRAKATDKGRLFASINSQNVANELSQRGVSINHKKILIPMTIKNLGPHTVYINILKNSKIKLNVVIHAE